MIRFPTRQISICTLFLFFLTACLYGQCPDFLNESATGNQSFMCEGETITINFTPQNALPGFEVEFYIGTGTFNPYNGEGTLVGSVPFLGASSFNWTVPSDFCEVYGEGDWSIVGI